MCDTTAARMGPASESAGLSGSLVGLLDTGRDSPPRPARYTIKSRPKPLRSSKPGASAPGVSELTQLADERAGRENLCSSPLRYETTIELLRRG